MRGSVSVEEAILRGKKTVMYPMVGILLGLPIVAILLSAQFDLTPWIIAAGGVLGFLFSWLYWSYAITHWRIWAYENVRNLHELKHKAFEHHLIKEDGTFSQRTEIRTKEQKHKLRQLEKKFLDEDVYRDDFNVPKEIKIRPALLSTFLCIGFGLVLLGITVEFLLIHFDEISLKVLLPIIIGGLLLFCGIQNLIEKEPPLILNAKGVKLPKIDLMGWNHITNEYIKREVRANYVAYFLVFEYKSKLFEVSIVGLHLKPNQIENAVRVYRIRFEKQQH